MRFADVVGQEYVKRQLIQSAKDNRIPHAQLLLGKEGTGALSLALAFAQYVLCEDPGEEESCGVCASCRKASQLIHPDLHFTFPIFKSDRTPRNKGPESSEWMKEWRKFALENPYGTVFEWLQSIQAENKQGNISATECRKMINTLNLKSYEAPYKIQIIWQAEYLGKEGNVLLKLIEEPPDNTLIILTASDPDQILNTILSRTQVLKLPRVKDQALQQHIDAEYDLKEKEIHSIVRLSEGNVNEALKLLDDKVAGYEEWFTRWYRMIVTGKQTEELAGWVDEMAAMGREQQKNFLRYCLHFFRESLMCANDPEYNLRLAPSQIKAAAYTADHMEMEQFQHIIEELEVAHYHIERNAHPKILFLNLTIRLKEVVHKQYQLLAKSRR